MPVSDIRWHIERLNKELTPKESDPQPMDKTTLRSPDDRAMAGMNRAHVPARLTRFT